MEEENMEIFEPQGNIAEESKMEHEVSQDGKKIFIDIETLSEDDRMKLARNIYDKIDSEKINNDRFKMIFSENTTLRFERSKEPKGFSFMRLENFSFNGKGEKTKSLAIINGSIDDKDYYLAIENAVEETIENLLRGGKNE